MVSHLTKNVHGIISNEISNVIIIHRKVPHERTILTWIIKIKRAIRLFLIKRKFRLAYGTEKRKKSNLKDLILQKGKKYKEPRKKLEQIYFSQSCKSKESKLLYSFEIRVENIKSAKSHIYFYFIFFYFFAKHFSECEQLARSSVWFD